MYVFKCHEVERKWFHYKTLPDSDL